MIIAGGERRYVWDISSGVMARCRRLKPRPFRTMQARLIPRFTGSAWREHGRTFWLCLLQLGRHGGLCLFSHFSFGRVRPDRRGLVAFLENLRVPGGATGARPHLGSRSDSLGSDEAFGLGM